VGSLALSLWRDGRGSVFFFANASAFCVSLIQLSRGLDSRSLEKFGWKKLSLIRWSGTCRA
jgi:hypothetical protein